MVPTFGCHLQGKGSTFISQYFKTLSVGQAMGIKLVNYHSAVKYSTDWASPDSVWHTVALKFLQNALKRHMAYKISRILGSSTRGPWVKGFHKWTAGKKEYWSAQGVMWCFFCSYYLFIIIERDIFNCQKNGWPKKTWKMFEEWLKAVFIAVISFQLGKTSFPILLLRRNPSGNWVILIALIIYACLHHTSKFHHQASFWN